MLASINNSFNSAKRKLADDRFIAESVLEVEEVIPGSEEEMDDIVDADSVPEDVYKKLDKALDELIDKDDYDDADIEELVDDDDDLDDVDDAEIDAIVNEAVEMWYDNEGIGHPNVDYRCDKTKEQPEFDAMGSLV